MRVKLSSKLIRQCLFSLISIFAISSIFANEFASSYQFSFDSPIEWKTNSRNIDTTGYTEEFIPQASGNFNEQNLTLNFGKNISTSLKDSMQQVIDNLAGLDCQTKESKVVKKEKNSLVFTTYLDKCSNNVTLLKVFKVINMPDGQYSIMYAANPKLVNPKILTSMKNAVLKAKLALNQH